MARAPHIYVKRMVDFCQVKQSQNQVLRDFYTAIATTPYYTIATYGGKIAHPRNFPADYFVSSEKVRIFAFLQMPCFTKEMDECENHFERWIYILKNMEILERMPWAAQNAVFRRLAEVAEVSALSKEERIKYDRALKRYRDMYNTITGAEAKGEVKGISKTARKMKEKGYAIEDIVDVTGLTADEIEQL